MIESYASEINKVIEKIKQISDIQFSFVYATDLHVDFRENHEVVFPQCEAMVEIANRTDVDCVMLGGDILHGISSKEESLAYLQEYVEIFKKAKVPTYVTRGNHDDNAYHNDPWIPPYDNKRVPHKYIVWDYEWNRTILEPLARGNAIHDQNYVESSYYYVDYPEKKIRVVFLDAYAYPEEKNGELSVWSAEGWNRFSKRQLKWFSEVALDTEKEGWTYILSNHGALIEGFVTGPCLNGDVPLSIIEAFNTKGKYTNKKLDINADYTNVKSRMPLHIFGHTHRDGYHYDKNAKMLMINTGVCANSEYNCSAATVDYCASPKREINTVTEALFDVIVLSENGTVHRIRFGAGEDQKFSI